MRYSTTPTPSIDTIGDASSALRSAAWALVEVIRMGIRKRTGEVNLRQCLPIEGNRDQGALVRAVTCTTTVPVQRAVECVPQEGVVAVKGQARNESHLLLKLVLIRKLPSLYVDDHRIELSNNIDGVICVTHAGVLDVVEG